MQERYNKGLEAAKQQHEQESRPWWQLPALPYMDTKCTFPSIRKMLGGILCDGTSVWLLTLMILVATDIWEAGPAETKGTEIVAIFEEDAMPKYMVPAKVDWRFADANISPMVV